MRRLTPHLSQAMKIHMRMAIQNAEHQTRDLLVGHSTTGVAFLDVTGRVLMLNPAAEDIISDTRNGMDVRDGQILFGNAANANQTNR